jgi:hypothetical protein
MKSEIYKKEFSGSACNYHIIYLAIKTGYTEYQNPRVVGDICILSMVAID